MQGKVRGFRGKADGTYSNRCFFFVLLIARNCDGNGDCSLNTSVLFLYWMLVKGLA